MKMNTKIEKKEKQNKTKLAIRNFENKIKELQFKSYKKRK